MRKHNDGKPFYCNTCNLGYGEYMACEELDCKLESEHEAQQRYVVPAPSAPPLKGLGIGGVECEHGYDTCPICDRSDT